MIIRYLPEYYQDSVPRRIDIIRDSLNSGTDSTLAGSDSDTLKTMDLLNDSLSAKKTAIVQVNSKQAFDTTLVCTRNSVADVTFHNYGYILSTIDKSYINEFPYQFTGNNIKRKSEKKALLEMHLRSGQAIPEKRFHDNWVFAVLIIAVLLFSIVQSMVKKFSPAITRFFLFRGTKEEGTRDIMGIFQWQSTLLNLSSFMVIALFGSYTASYFNIIPSGLNDFLTWLISLGAIIVAVTLRHVVCLLTGLLSNQGAVFHDYLHTIYQSYRFGAFIIFILVIMMLYTNLLPEGSYFLPGVVIVGILLIIRLIRLLILFINRNISIFYLILYLCALEILPVLITIKYFSGLA